MNNFAVRPPSSKISHNTAASTKSTNDASSKINGIQDKSSSLINNGMINTSSNLPALSTSSTSSPQIGIFTPFINYFTFHFSQFFNQI